MKPIRVMIAEDDRSTRELLELHICATEDLELCPSAENGQEALSLIFCEQPDLLLLDLVMPLVDGVQVLEHLLSNPPPRRPKIIVTSAVTSDRVVRSAMRLGADYYVVKPCDISALIRRIRELFAPVSPVEENPAVTCLLNLGADERDLGFRFACAALGHLIQEEEPQLKTVYLQVAAECDSSYERVERNLRTMVRKLHALCSPQYAALFGDIDRPPANGVFLRALAHTISST